MNEFEIEKGVPRPEGKRRGKFSNVPNMEVNDSIFVPGISPGASGRASDFNRKHAPKKFTSARAEKDGVQGYRIWRIE